MTHMPFFITDGNYLLNFTYSEKKIKHGCFVINVISTLVLTRHEPYNSAAVSKAQWVKIHSEVSFILSLTNTGFYKNIH